MYNLYHQIKIGRRGTSGKNCAGVVEAVFVLTVIVLIVGSVGFFAGFTSRLKGMTIRLRVLVAALGVGGFGTSASKECLGLGMGSALMTLDIIETGERGAASSLKVSVLVMTAVLGLGSLSQQVMEKVCSPAVKRTLL